jgi:hypothetical protein
MDPHEGRIRYQSIVDRANREGREGQFEPEGPVEEEEKCQKLEL